jgi:hypothetical protein
MVKSLSAFAAFSLLGASIIALPGFTPKVQTSDIAVAKGDRLDVWTVSLNCSTQVWPDLAASCLRDARSGGTIREARLVTVRR